jgi:hypothetical protein
MSLGHLGIIEKIRGDRHHLQTLTQGGVMRMPSRQQAWSPPPTDALPEDPAWRQYRPATYLMIFMPLVAIHAWERTNERGRDLCLVLMERALAAIEDLEVHSLLLA